MTPLARNTRQKCSGERRRREARDFRWAKPPIFFIKEIYA